MCRKKAAMWTSRGTFRLEAHNCKDSEQQSSQHPENNSMLKQKQWVGNRINSERVYVAVQDISKSTSFFRGKIGSSMRLSQEQHDYSCITKG